MGVDGEAFGGIREVRADIEDGPAPRGAVVATSAEGLGDAVTGQLGGQQAGQAPEGPESGGPGVAGAGSTLVAIGVGQDPHPVAGP